MQDRRNKSQVFNSGKRAIYQICLVLPIYRLKAFDSDISLHRENGSGEFHTAGISWFRSTLGARETENIGECSFMSARAVLFIIEMKPNHSIFRNSYTKTFQMKSCEVFRIPHIDTMNPRFSNFTRYIESYFCSNEGWRAKCSPFSHIVQSILKPFVTSTDKSQIFVCKVLNKIQ